jgi:prephenate dehydrogenase
VNIAVLGVGLIGGSIGLAARERLGAQVSGFDPAPRALAEALEIGAITRSCPSVAEAVADADVAFVATPVGAVADTLRAALAEAPGSCVVSDVGSTKRAVVAAVEDLRFIGGHPLAGAESAGVRHARADLFDGATWFLTPSQQTPGIHYERLHRLLVDVGARPAALDAATHDRVMACVSHLPHVLANVMVAQAAHVLDEHGERLPHAGPSLRDATRVAGANTAMWRDVYLSNADVLIEALDEYVSRLQEVREALVARDGDRIAAWNDAAREDRHRLLESDHGAGAVHELRVSVPNRPGVVAEVALALGRAGVNITDMALHPAPDGRSGWIGLWIAGARAAEDAQRLMRDLGLPVTRP